MNSLIWKRLIGRCFRKSQLHKIILIYHSVGSNPWAISKNDFKEQINWLKSNAQIVALTELLTTPLKKNTIEVALTFDDGYACLFDVVAPILRAENATATVYINTGWIGENANSRFASRADLGHYPDEKFLTWDEVKALDQQGWEIGSHGVDHLDLTQCANATVKNELSASKKMIEQQLQKKCSHFAYTWGKHTAKLQCAVKNAGYHYAAAAHHEPYTDTNNLMSLPRLYVGQDFTLDDFKNTVSGKWDFIGKIQRAKRWIKKIY